jgi:hypothetical protein
MTAGGGRGARVRLAAAGVLLLVFVAGAAAGWGMAGRQHAQRRGRPGGGPPGPFGMLGGPNLMARLNLTPAESLAVDSAFKRRLLEAEAFWRGPGQQWRAILDSTRADVRAALPAPKRATYDSLMSRGRRGPGGGPPNGSPTRATGGPPRP